MNRLVLVDTVDQLPGLLPLHAWTALSTTDLILIGDPAHPLAAHFDNADLRYEVVPEPDAPEALSRRDLLGGVDPLQRARVSWIVDRARDTGAVAYVYGAADTEAFTRALGFEAARNELEVEVVYFGLAPKGVELLELVRVEQRLRGPDGCPWDREQDHASLATHAVEEVYELSEAIATGAADDIREELGDVLLQVVFHAQIAEDDGTFDIDAVARGIVDKLVRRHPHVFGDARVDDAASVMRNWDQLKAAEKPDREGPFDGVPLSQPALPLAAAVQRRAARLGFDDADAGAALAGVRSAVDRAAAATGDVQAAHEIGDLLAAVVALARHLDVDPELALRGSAGRFRARFEAALANADRPAQELSRDDWRALWDAARSTAT
ncbi:MAG TPA: nucleoside triphosphate pyrophosphohydrolase [Euzebyales bacterium]|nr:nucleoside triphosphate pyrophosphohydrolase [Euzebyales bacterium]